MGGDPNLNTSCRHGKHCVTGHFSSHRGLTYEDDLANASYMVNAPPAPPATGPLGVVASAGTAEDSSLPSGAGGPAPGELRIKERRSWRTWQVIIFGIACLLLGMLITWNGDTGGATAPRTATGGSYNLPPPAGATSATTAPGTAGATTQPAASGATTVPTTAATTTTTGAVQVLLGPTPETHGNWTSSPFTVGGGTWSIGWAFQCTPAPVSGPSFQVFVVPAGGKAGSTPAVNESGASGQSVTTQSSVGSQELEVVTPAACLWEVKVSGAP